MSDLWKQFEGQVVDNRFPLQQFLGGTASSAVFLTQLADSQSQKAVIKFVPAGNSAELQLSLWRRAVQLSHPNLLRLFHFGRCRLAAKDFLYVLMEFAEEDLSQIIPQRPLTAAEARQMLEPVLDVLIYLHARGLVHSRIKPSNILATGDQLKLSSDTLFPVGESRKFGQSPSVHDAPESATSALTPAADVWSLGMTLVEALTQQPPAIQPGNPADPQIPEKVPQPFLDIARHALRTEPKRRWTVPEIAARLNPIAAAAAAGQSGLPLPAPPLAASPLAVPLSSVPAVPAAKLQIPKPTAATPKAQSPVPSASTASKQAIVLPNYVIPLAAVILVIVAIVALPRILGHRPESPSSTASALAQPATPAKSTESAPQREVPPASKLAKPTASQNTLTSATERKTSAEKQPPLPAAPAPASLRTDTFPSANAPVSSASSQAHGDVLDQILPDVSEKARATIQGKVRVGVRVRVDASGNVSEATLDSPGPSKYFADLALQAARRWQFASPEIGGHSVPSEWLIRFEFSQSGSAAFPKQTAP